MEALQLTRRGGGNSGSAFDWISVTSSVVAAIVGLITLLTVYVAAMQILSRRQLYRLGVSTKSLGPWKPKVVTPSLLRMQTKISTPTISLPRLVAQDWQPNISFPTGFTTNKSTKAPANFIHKSARTASGFAGKLAKVPSGLLTGKPLKVVSDPELLAEASWVNFLQALGLTPESTGLYEMQAEAELVNGIVPMRWKGRDLVGICSMLGFQSHEDKPSARTPMPLPMLWSGPLGWLQFRASSDGCIVEYRRRGEFKDLLSQAQYDFYDTFQPQPVCLKSRLWQSINGLYLPDDRLLYIGGEDLVTEKLKERRDNQPRSMEDICKDVVSSDLTDEQMIKALWRKKANRPDAVCPGTFKRGPSQLPQSDSLPEFLREISSRIIRKYEKSECLQVLKRCPGLLSMVVEGELASIRGLDLTLCDELNRVYKESGEVESKFTAALGHFRMEPELLGLLKKAVLLLKPDGFYFTPTKHLCNDVNAIWQHVTDKSEGLECIFPVVSTSNPQTGAEWGGGGDIMKLYHAMALCNQFQQFKLSSPVMFTIADMGVISKASRSLRDMVSEAGTDIIWAMIKSSDLFSYLLERFRQMGTQKDVQNLLEKTVNYEKGVLDCTSLNAKVEDPVRKFPVPLMENREFSGAQVLAAFLDVFLTYFWIEKSWTSDVAVYDATVPQSVTMC